MKPTPNPNKSNLTGSLLVWLVFQLLLVWLFQLYFGHRGATLLLLALLFCELGVTYRYLKLFHEEGQDRQPNLNDHQSGGLASRGSANKLSLFEIVGQGYLNRLNVHTRLRIWLNWSVTVFLFAILGVLLATQLLSPQLLFFSGFLTVAAIFQALPLYPTQGGLTTLELIRSAKIAKPTSLRLDRVFRHTSLTALALTGSYLLNSFLPLLVVAVVLAGSSFVGRLPLGGSTSEITTPAKLGEDSTNNSDPIDQINTQSLNSLEGQDILLKYTTLVLFQIISLFLLLTYLRTTVQRELQLAALQGDCEHFIGLTEFYSPILSYTGELDQLRRIAQGCSVRAAAQDEPPSSQQSTDQPTTTPKSPPSNDQLFPPEQRYSPNKSVQMAI
jgi:hypothetical protein